MPKNDEPTGEAELPGHTVADDSPHPLRTYAGVLRRRWLWIVLDVIYTGVFLYKALYLTARLYAGFVVLAIYGLLAWQRELRTEDGAPALVAGQP